MEGEEKTLDKFGTDIGKIRVGIKDEAFKYIKEKEKRIENAIRQFVDDLYQNEKEGIKTIGEKEELFYSLREKKFEEAGIKQYWERSKVLDSSMTDVIIKLHAQKEKREDLNWYFSNMLSKESLIKYTREYKKKNGSDKK